MNRTTAADCSRISNHKSDTKVLIRKCTAVFQIRMSQPSDPRTVTSNTRFQCRCPSLDIRSLITRFGIFTNGNFPVVTAVIDYLCPKWVQSPNGDWFVSINFSPGLHSSQQSSKIILINEVLIAMLVYISFPFCRAAPSTTNYFFTGVRAFTFPAFPLHSFCSWSSPEFSMEF